MRVEKGKILVRVFSFFLSKIAAAVGNDLAAWDFSGS